MPNKDKTFKSNLIEPKWQNEWEEKGIYRTPQGFTGKKNYILDMFPYPSGATMHVGHLEGYVGTDILSRYYRMKGEAVFHPMGWDAFGLPAENYAIKTGIHPDKSTHENIKTFKRQLGISGMSYDWNHEIDTSSPEFYKWTQWIFIQLFKKGLAYKKKAPVNWCSKDETVLANEQVINGKCERCETPVIQKDMEQWFFKITAYADRLISGLNKIDWPSEVKVQQINWIGKSEGASVKFKIENSDKEIKVYTTRPDTLYGATFMVLSPESAWVGKVTSKEEREKVSKYIKECRSKAKSIEEIEREKTGVFSGSYAINPVNKKKIPIWIADYVLAGYGTGAIMAVPAHDKRDWDFAKKYDLEIIEVISGGKNLDKGSYEGEGKIINSEKWNGYKYPQDLDKVIADLESKKCGEKAFSYHLRDWLISRQRYWGCPIPMIYCKKDGWQPVPEEDLPVLLPKDVDFLPHGESPITRSKTFQEGVGCPKCGKPAKREVDTMDTYVDSSWYFIRFVDPQNTQEYASQERIKTWLPVDNYVGGGHVVQHLLFARFFWKVLYDTGFIDKSLGDEPFLKLRAPGWILGSDSRKMSKRWNNIVTPDEIIPKFGADTLRVYEMFMGPFDVMKPWSTTGVEGASRFLGRVWRFFNQKPKEKVDSEVNIEMHQTTKKVTEDIERYKFNTAISSLMELVNTITEKGADKEILKNLCLLLAPFAPHLAEEIWVEVLGQKFSVHQQPWPKYDPKLVQEENVVIVIQVNGKLRSQLIIDNLQASNKEEVEKLARKDEKAAKWLKDGKIKQTILVPGKLINFVIS